MNSTALEAILDVAIGMIFMWLILSVATMSIQEWIRQLPEMARQ